MMEEQEPIHAWWTESLLVHLLRERPSAENRTGEERAFRIVERSVRIGAFTVKVRRGPHDVHQVRIHAALLSDADWTGIERAMAADLSVLARAMAGVLPDPSAALPGIWAVYSSDGADPARDCSCGVDRCAHVLPAVEALATELDADPLLAFHILGRTKRELIRRVAAAGIGSAQRGSPDRRESEIGDFWGERWLEPGRMAATHSGRDGTSAVLDAPRDVQDKLASAYECFMEPRADEARPERPAEEPPT